MEDRRHTAGLVVISGCSGGGKSTLLGELARREYRVIEEPGRRIVVEETAADGSALPWVDMAAFARRAVAMAMQDRLVVGHPARWTFFDRGLIDAASALHHVTGDAFIDTLKPEHRYHHKVFMTPPWPEIYRQDSERQHDFDAAIEEYERLLKAYEALDYHVVILPKTSVSERADFVLSQLGAD
jgi:predicted ATPase